MKFSDLKKESKEQLHSHYGFFMLLLLPFYIVGLVTFIRVFSVVLKAINHSGNITSGFHENGIISPSTLIQSLDQALLLGACFVMIKVIRNQENDYKNGFKKAFNIFSRKDYFTGALGIGILKGLYTALWIVLPVGISVGLIAASTNVKNNTFNLLLFSLGVFGMFMSLILAIIKQISFSQAQYIYRDAINNNKAIKANDAITQSQQLMDRHKWEFFLLYLSFFPWYILNLITLELANIFYVMPYTTLTFANYYVHLIDNK